MTWRDFRIGWRMLLQQPAYSLVVIGGLAVGFAACFLMFGYVAYCLNYNSTVPDNERVVAVKARINIAPRPSWQLEAALPLRDVALNSGLVSAASIAKLINFGKPLRVGAEQHDVNVVAVDPAFRTLFNLIALEGDLPAALSRPDGLALTRTAAAKLFGSRSALGHTVQVNDITLQVLAVIADPPANGSAWYQALVGTASSTWLQRSTAFANSEMGAIYLKLKPGASMASLAALLEAAAANSLFDRQFREGPMGKSLNGRNVSDVRLVALRDAYFDDDLASSSDAYGRRSSVLGMAAGGLLVLMLGTINYVNLATVRTLRRQREIGLRKLLGASTGQLVRQFLSEAVLTTMLAAAAGLLLAWLLLPTFSGLVDRDLAGSFTAAHGVIALVFSVAVGLAAGAYPAWLARHALPAAALAGRGSNETIAGLWARRVLTVLQFGSAMALSACRSNLVCASPPLDAAVLATPAADSGATQFGKAATTGGARLMPMSAQVLALSESPRRTTSGPMVVLKNLAMAPSGPKISPISALLASARDSVANGYFSARFLLNGCSTCATQTLSISASVGLTMTAKVCISGRTRIGRIAIFCASVIPISICSSTYLRASASSEPVPSSVCCISCLAPGPGSPWFLIWLKRVRSLDICST